MSSLNVSISFRTPEQCGRHILPPERRTDLRERDLFSVLLFSLQGHVPFRKMFSIYVDIFWLAWLSGNLSCASGREDDFVADLICQGRVFCLIQTTSNFFFDEIKHIDMFAHCNCVDHHAMFVSKEKNSPFHFQVCPSCFGDFLNRFLRPTN